MGPLLTIVPHDPLFQLSFAILLDSRNRYLVERYALNTIPAVGLLRYTEKNEADADALPPHRPRRQPAAPATASRHALPPALECPAYWAAFSLSGQS